MAERDSILPNRDEPLFPLTERSTPLVDRLQNLRNGEDSIPRKLGGQIGQVILSDEDNKSEVADEAGDAFREGLANKLGVPKEAIQDEVVMEFKRFYTSLEEEDVINDDLMQALEMDMGEGGDDKDEDSPEFGSEE